MEGNRISSSKLKRKPLSDCTNTLPNSKLKLKSKSLTLAKPAIKPSSTSPQITQKNINPNINSNSNNDVVVFRSSVNSRTGTGSNIFPNSDSLPSQPSTPLSRAGAVVHRKSGRSETLTQRQDEQTNKDRGKSVATTSIIQASAYLTSRPVQIPSSGNGGHVITPPEVENHEVEQRRMDKGKMVVESPIISDPLTSHALPTSSSAASGNFYLPEPSAVHSHNHNEDAQAKKDFRRTDLEIHSAEASGPTTPHSLISSSHASGTDGQEKTGLIVYSQRRSSQRKRLVGNISFAFSCPPDKRTKKKGVELDDAGGDGHSGLHTYLVPEQKKQARNKKDNSVHAMPQDEVEKLKAYYESIDSFELPEEVASETELDHL